MRVVQINMVHFGSTGKIMFQIAKAASENGIQMRTFSAIPASKRFIKLPPAPEGHAYYSTRLGSIIHSLLARFTGGSGFYSRFSTWKLLRKIKAFQPDILHLHNLHTGYLNLPMVFQYAKKATIQVIWTLHDCWAFTGRCPHFVLANCNKWKTGCYECPQWKEYAAGADRSKQLWNKKKKTFTSLERFTLVTPSHWLEGLTRQSFLGVYPVKVIHNGIDLSVFQPMDSDFRKKYNCENKFVVLGVAFDWGKRKGLDVFLQLAAQLDSDYQIVLVGTNEQIDTQLPDNIISIHRTQDQQELAQIYGAADLFVNPTREENYPTVNMEALACGTPVVTFRTGGSPEIPDETCGSVVDCDDFSGLLAEILRIHEAMPYTKEACLKRAESFNMYHRYEEYIQLYKDCLKEKNC